MPTAIAIGSAGLRWIRVSFDAILCGHKWPRIHARNLENLQNEIEQNYEKVNILQAEAEQLLEEAKRLWKQCEEILLRSGVTKQQLEWGNVSQAQLTPWNKLRLSKMQKRQNTIHNRVSELTDEAGRILIVTKSDLQKIETAKANV